MTAHCRPVSYTHLALDEADAENAAEQNTPTETPVAPRVADVTAPADTDTPDEDNAV